jgi:hypothetical protein
MIQPIQPFCLSMWDLFYAEIICKSNCINLPFCAMIKLKYVLFIMRGYLDTYCSVFRSLLLSAIIWIPDVRSLPLDLFTLINFVIEQMHRAVFVLPTFAKKELEAYCFSTGRVSFYKSVFAITLYLLCFHSLRIFLKASSYWREPVYRFIGTARGNSCNSTKDYCCFEERNSHCILDQGSWPITVYQETVPSRRSWVSSG